MFFPFKVHVIFKGVSPLATWQFNWTLSPVLDSPSNSKAVMWGSTMVIGKTNEKQALKRKGVWKIVPWMCKIAEYVVTPALLPT